MKRALLTLGLIGCGGGSDTGAPQPSENDFPYCDESVTALGWDETAADGTVPAELRDAVVGTVVVPFEYEVGAGTELTLVAAVVGEPEWVDAEAVYPDSGPDIGVICPDGVRFEVELSFATADGAFDEQWTVVFQSGNGYGSTSTGAAVLRFSVRHDPAAIGGSFVPSSDPGDYDFLEVQFDGSLGGGYSSGSVSVNGQQTSGNAVSYGLVESVGVWP